MTGSYNNIFRVFNRESNQDIALEASRDNIATATHVLDAVNFVSGKVICGVRAHCHRPQDQPRRRDRTICTWMR